MRDSQKLLSRIYAALDAGIIAFSYISAYHLRFRFLIRFAVFELLPDEKYYPLAVYGSYLYAVLPAYMILYTVFSLYKPDRSTGRRKEVTALLKANIIGLLFFVFLLYATKKFDIARLFSGVFFLLNFSIATAYRQAFAAILHALRKKGFNQKHVLIVGYSRAAEGYMDRITSNPHWGYNIHGVLDDTMEEGTLYKHIPVIGSIHGLEETIYTNSFDEIVVALSIYEYAKLEEVVGICEKSGVHTKFLPDYNTIIPTVPYIEDMYGLPIIHIRKVPLNNVFNRAAKRLVDILGSLFAVVLFGLPMLLAAILIKATSPGPVIYAQRRVGLHNKEFKMYKFRSMRVQPESAEKLGWTTANDPRVTKVGRFLRKTSIDELPQLFNILAGRMSLVGPRPERPQFVEKFKEEIPRYMIKHQVRPGLTGWAQVNGLRGDTSIRKRVACDLYYIENWTLGFDFKILFLTVFKGFINKNAY